MDPPASISLLDFMSTCSSPTCQITIRIPPRICSFIRKKEKLGRELLTMYTRKRSKWISSSENDNENDNDNDADDDSVKLG